MCCREWSIVEIKTKKVRTNFNEITGQDSSDRTARIKKLSRTGQS